MKAKLISVLMVLSFLLTACSLLDKYRDDEASKDLDPMEQAEEFADDGDVDKAIDLYEDIIEDDSENLEAYFGLASLLYYEEDYDGVSETLERVYKLLEDLDEDDREDAIQEISKFINQFGKEDIDLDDWMKEFDVAFGEKDLAEEETSTTSKEEHPEATSDEREQPKTEKEKETRADKEVETTSKDEPATTEAEIETLPVEAIDFTVTASSSLKEMINGSEYTHGPLNISDGTINTAWAEGIDGSGVGEWILFEGDGAFDLDTVDIVNGYAKTENLYEINSRLITMLLIASNGEERSITLQDGIMDFQTVQVGFKNITSVKLIISEIQPGSKYNDTCLSEIKFNGQQLALISGLN